MKLQEAENGFPGYFTVSSALMTSAAAAFTAGAPDPRR